MAKNKYFILSDPHGEANVMINGLEEAGFDARNSNHYVILIGDGFDRGPDSAHVYKFMKNLGSRGIYIKGNHDCFFQEYLEKGIDGEFVFFNILHNGLGATINSFAGKDQKDVYDTHLLEEYSSLIQNRYPGILNWLKNLPLYYETKHFIFVHAGFDPSKKDWKETDEDFMLWDISSSHQTCYNTNKIVVIGHHHAAKVRANGKRCGIPDYDIAELPYILNTTECNAKVYGNTDENRIYFTGSKICMDGMTNFTRKQNILVIEDEPYEEPKKEKEEEQVITSVDGGITAEEFVDNTIRFVNTNPGGIAYTTTNGGFTYTMDYNRFYTNG